MKYFFITILFLTFSCQKKEKNSFEDFSEFNRKFHSDSIFQMERIKFPIDGELTTRNGKEKWSKENWKILKKQFGAEVLSGFDHNTELKDNIATEKISLPDGSLSYETKFEIKDKKWFLVYFNKVNLPK